MKLLNLLMWVGQFGFSVIFPTLFFLIVAVWLQEQFQLGGWILVVMGILGVMTSISATRSCLRALCKAAEEASSREKPPIAFNDHQ